MSEFREGKKQGSASHQRTILKIFGQGVGLWSLWLRYGFRVEEFISKMNGMNVGAPVRDSNRGHE